MEVSNDNNDNTGWSAANIPTSSQGHERSRTKVLLDETMTASEDEFEEDSNKYDTSGGGWMPLGIHTHTKRRNSTSLTSSPSPPSSSLQKRNRETAEAAVSRLTTCYHTALKCIGALHRLDKAFVELVKDTTTNITILQLQGECYHVAHCAKSLLQHVVLSDPLLSFYTPTLQISLRDLAVVPAPNAQGEQGDTTNTTAASTTTLSSTHHKSLRNLAYLSLLNYADLLMLGTNTQPRAQLQTQQQDILSQGVIPPLQCLINNNTTLWEDNNNKGFYHADNHNSAIIRLALSAYIDATQIDATDPTLWLKIACTARALSNTEQVTYALVSAVTNPKNSNKLTTTTDHHHQTPKHQLFHCKLDCFRLEVYAIQRGILAVPPHLPPNRLLLSMATKHSLHYHPYLDTYTNNESPLETDTTQTATTTSTLHRSKHHSDTTKVIVHATHHTLHLTLNRYSWNTLGRSLLRAYRDISSFPSTVQYYHYSPMVEDEIVQMNDEHRITDCIGAVNLIPSPSNWAKNEQKILLISSNTRDKYPHYHQDHPPNASFGSPSVEIHIVPFIAYLSVSNLSIVCSYLDSPDVKCLEVSCRTISSAVMAMRARIDGGEQQHQHQQSIRQQVINHDPNQQHQQQQQLSIEEDLIIPSAHHQDIQDTSVKINDKNVVETSQPNNSNTAPEMMCSKMDNQLVVSNLGGTTMEGTQIELTHDIHLQEQQHLPDGEGVSKCQSQAEASSNNTNRKGQNRTRSSTRVRSQRLLSQDRHSVDSSLRTSLDRCVAVSVFGYNIEYPFQQSISTVLSRMTSAEDSDVVTEYARLVGELLSAKEPTFWIKLPSLRKGAEVLRKTNIFKKNNSDRHHRSDSTVSDYDDMVVVNTSAIAKEQQVTEIQSRIGQTSLNSFVKSCGRNSGPLDIMERFLTHVSLHVQDIFTSEQANDSVMMLSSCLLDCFDLVASRDGPLRSFATPYWVGSIGPTALLDLGTSSPNNVSQGLKAFTMNLLAAELKLRQCDRQQLDVNDIDGDSAAVSYLVPTLVEIMNVWTACGFLPKNESPDIRTAWQALKIRTHWLASMFYLWWSRCSVDPAVSSRVEKLSLNHLDNAVEAFDSLNRTNILSTPHLESPSRTGNHWKELSKLNLLAYKEEIQAASIVSHARLEFMHIREKLQTSSREQEKAEIHIEGQYSRLKELGRGLLGRYGEYECNADRYEDLIRDFLSCSEIRDMLLHAGKNYRYENPLNDSKCFDPIINWGSKLWDVLPCSFDSMKTQCIANTSHPSQIEILAVCCVQEPELYLSFLHVLVRLIVSVYDQRSKFKSLQMKHFRHEAAPTTFFSDRESSSEESEESECDSSSVANNGREDKRELLKLLAAKFFMEKITHFLIEIQNQNHCIQSTASFLEFISSVEVQSVLQVSFGLAAKSSELAEYHPHWTKSDDCEFGTERSHSFDSSKAASTLSRKCRFFPDRSMLWISYRLTDSLLSFGDGDNLRSLEILLFMLLSKSLVEEQHTLASILLQRGDRRSRSIRHRTCLAIGDFVSDIAVMFSDLLSRFPFKKVEGKSIAPSFVQCSPLNALASGKDDKGSRSSHIMSSALELASLIQLSDSLLWFWRHFSTIGASDAGPTAFRAADAAIVKSLSQRLDASIACALISFIGSFVNYGSVSLLGACKETAAEASENDAVDCLSSEDDHGNNISCTMPMKRCIFTLSTAVRGISVIYNGVKDRNILSFFPPERKDNGPLLPLVVSNTLNNIADIFLDICKKSDDDFWVETYPRGLETIGSEIDSLLSKAYGSLHGFNLLGGSQDGPKSVTCFPPETVKATLRIFRLMKRLYPSTGRRMPPRAALECVLKYLPETKGKQQDAAIRSYIFNHPVASSDSVVSVFQKDEELNSNLFPFDFPLWILETKANTTASECQKDVSCDLEFEGIPWNVLRKVQLELTLDLARVPIPRMELCNSNSSKSSVPVGDETPEGSCVDEREVLARYEFAIWQKIDTIINYLCFSPDDCKGWFDIAQCLSSKADYIRDRLVTKDDENAERKFFPWPSVVTRERHSRAYRLEELNSRLTVEDERVDLGSLPCLGRDLSVYLRNPWSTLPTLRCCAEEISRVICTDETANEQQYEQKPTSLPKMTEIVAFNCVQSLEPSMWQNAWGGLYVGALQSMAKKCLQVTYCLAKSLTDRNRVESSQLVAEVCEAIGTLLYKELQGSWQYGFPICRMTGKKKYDLAEQAANRYSESLDLAMSSSGKEDFNATWGLHLMIGKCYEKMANVYSLECFDGLDNQTEQQTSKRKYAQLLEKAFRHYSASLERVKIAEEEGLVTEQQMGGSSHGSIEVVYRIHASRLKVLLRAVSQNKKIRRSFEAEALNLISCNWFSEPMAADNEQQCLNLNDKEKRWEVLVDIVSAFVFCRQEKGLFHRSVYRHAQAILWAPIVYDPDADCHPLLTNTEGIFAQPSVLSNVYQDVVCANAAKTVMESIFDKKRTQLCATWLESRFHRPFEELNQSEKKFDLVRLKYIAARIELLRVCRDLESLQTFLSWASSCLPDLPNLYFATAQRESASRHDHRHDNLLMGFGFLRNVKRLCTMAIADVILFHIHQYSKSGITSGMRSMNPMELLRIAYSCYLKLNCTIEDLLALEEDGEEYIIEVDALLSAFDRVKGTLAENTALKEKLKGIETVDVNVSEKASQLQAVLATCKALFLTRKKKRKSGGEQFNVGGTHTGVETSPRKLSKKTS